MHYVILPSCKIMWHNQLIKQQIISVQLARNCNRNICTLCHCQAVFAESRKNVKGVLIVLHFYWTLPLSGSTVDSLLAESCHELHTLEEFPMEPVHFYYYITNFFYFLLTKIILWLKVVVWWEHSKRFPHHLVPHVEISVLVAKKNKQKQTNKQNKKQWSSLSEKQSVCIFT